MSCEKNSSKISRVCAARSGISAAGSKVAGVAGVISAGASQALDTADRAALAYGRKSAAAVRSLSGGGASRAGPDTAGRKSEGKEALRRTAASITMLAASRPQTRRAALSALRAAGSATASSASVVGKIGGKALPFVPLATAAVKTSDTISRELGTAAAKLTATGSAGTFEKETRRFFLFKSKTEVPFWKSRLTPMLNRADAAVGLKPREVVSSKGAMFEAGGKTWHQGSTVVKVDGKERNVTHLQSLSLPAQHYYFDRPINKEQSVGIATGEIKAEDVPGYKGRVSQYESIAPVWAGTKQGMIRSQIYWPEED